MNKVKFVSVRNWKGNRVVIIGREGRRRNTYRPEGYSCYRLMRVLYSLPIKADILLFPDNDDLSVIYSFEEE